jgi:resuscitation-promoting factor RpfA
MSKSADAFRTISEVAEWLDTPAHVLRFWESKFTQVKPVKRAGGRRYYRPGDMRMLGGIKKLLHDDGMTIKGVQKILREQGIRHVSSLCALSVGDDEDFEEIILEDVPSSEPIDTVVPFAKPTEPDPPSPELFPEPREVEESEPELTLPEPAADLPVEAEQGITDETLEVETTVTASAPDDVSEDVESASQDPALEQADIVETTVDASVAETVTEPEFVQEALEPKVAETAALPRFLQRSISDRIEHPEPDSSDAPTSEVTDSVPRPAQVADPAEPTAGPLTHLARITRLSPDTAKEIEPVAARLRSLIG